MKNEEEIVDTTVVDGPITFPKQPVRRWLRARLGLPEPLSATARGLESLAQTHRELHPEQYPEELVEVEELEDRWTEPLQLEEAPDPLKQIQIPVKGTTPRKDKATFEL